MKADRYIKAVLSVIAACQLYGVGKDLIGPAYAQNIVNVRVVEWGAYVAMLPLPVRVQP